MLISAPSSSTRLGLNSFSVLEEPTLEFQHVMAVGDQFGAADMSDEEDSDETLSSILRTHDQEENWRQQDCGKEVTLPTETSRPRAADAHLIPDPLFKPQPQSAPADIFHIAVLRSYEPLRRLRIETECATATNDESVLESASSVADEEGDEEIRSNLSTAANSSEGRGFGVGRVDTNPAPSAASSTVPGDSPCESYEAHVHTQNPTAFDSPLGLEVAWGMRERLDSTRKKQRTVDRFLLPSKALVSQIETSMWSSHYDLVKTPSSDPEIAPTPSTSTEEREYRHSSVTSEHRKTTPSTLSTLSESTDLSHTMVDSRSSLGPQPTFRFIGVAVPSIPGFKHRGPPSFTRQITKRRRVDTSDDEFDPALPRPQLIRRRTSTIIQATKIPSKIAFFGREIGELDGTAGPCVDDIDLSSITLRPPKGSSLNAGTRRTMRAEWSGDALRDGVNAAYATGMVLMTTLLHILCMALFPLLTVWVLVSVFGRGIGHALSACRYYVLKTAPRGDLDFGRARMQEYKTQTCTEDEADQQEAYHVGKEFIRGASDGVLDEVSHPRLRRLHEVPLKWLPHVDLQSARVDPSDHPQTRPCTRDFPTGAPTLSAVDFAAIIFNNGGKLENDGHEDTFSEGETSNARTPDDTSGPVVTARKNHLVVVPGKKLPAPAKHEHILPSPISHLGSPLPLPELSPSIPMDAPDELLSTSPCLFEENLEDPAAIIDEGIDDDIARDIARMVNFSP
ncbi:hypothetical protein FRC17_005232 [Serendipita sp. 399]|nr:hypothetical protein FRC17_005232 [Serendipita sp. 399]